MASFGSAKEESNATRPACQHPYLHFSESRQTSRRSLPKALQTLPFLGTEVPGEMKRARQPPQQGVQCEHGVLAQSKGRSLSQEAQGKPCPNSCQAQSLLMRRVKAWRQCLCPQARCGCGSGPKSLFSTSILSSSACRQAQACQGQILLREHTVSPLSGARTELLEAPAHRRKDFDSPPLPDMPN